MKGWLNRKPQTKAAKGDGFGEIHDFKQTFDPRFGEQPIVSDHESSSQDDDLEEDDVFLPDDVTTDSTTTGEPLFDESAFSVRDDETLNTMDDASNPHWRQSKANSYLQDFLESLKEDPSPGKDGSQSPQKAPLFDIPKIEIENFLDSEDEEEDNGITPVDPALSECSSGQSEETPVDDATQSSGTSSQKTVDDSESSDDSQRSRKKHDPDSSHDDFGAIFSQEALFEASRHSDAQSSRSHSDCDAELGADFAFDNSQTMFSQSFGSCDGAEPFVDNLPSGTDRSDDVDEEGSCENSQSLSAENSSRSNEFDARFDAESSSGGRLHSDGQSSNSQDDFDPGFENEPSFTNDREHPDNKGSSEHSRFDAGLSFESRHRPNPLYTRGDDVFNMENGSVQHSSLQSSFGNICLDINLKAGESFEQSSDESLSRSNEFNNDSSADLSFGDNQHLATLNRSCNDSELSSEDSEFSKSRSSCGQHDLNARHSPTDGSRKVGEANVGKQLVSGNSFDSEEVVSSGQVDFDASDGRSFGDNDRFASLGLQNDSSSAVGREMENNRTSCVVAESNDIRSVANTVSSMVTDSPPCVVRSQEPLNDEFGRPSFENSVKCFPRSSRLGSGQHHVGNSEDAPMHDQVDFTAAVSTTLFDAEKELVEIDDESHYDGIDGELNDRLGMVTGHCSDISDSDDSLHDPNARFGFSPVRKKIQTLVDVALPNFRRVPLDEESVSTASDHKPEKPGRKRSGEGLSGVFEGDVSLSSFDASPSMPSRRNSIHRNGQSVLGVVSSHSKEGSDSNEDFSKILSSSVHKKIGNANVDCLISNCNELQSSHNTSPHLVPRQMVDNGRSALETYSDDSQFLERSEMVQQENDQRKSVGSCVGVDVKRDASTLKCHYNSSSDQGVEMLQKFTPELADLSLDENSVQLQEFSANAEYWDQSESNEEGFNDDLMDSTLREHIDRQLRDDDMYSIAEASCETTSNSRSALNREKLEAPRSMLRPLDDASSVGTSKDILKGSIPQENYSHSEERIRVGKNRWTASEGHIEVDREQASPELDKNDRECSCHDETDKIRVGKSVVQASESTGVDGQSLKETESMDSIGISDEHLIIAQQLLSAGFSSDSEDSHGSDAQKLSTGVMEKQLDKAKKMLSDDADDGSSEEDYDSSSGEDSQWEDGSEDGTPHKLVVRELPILRLENVTAQTRSNIPETKLQKRKVHGAAWSGWLWGGKKPETGSAEIPKPSPLPKHTSETIQLIHEVKEPEKHAVGPRVNEPGISAPTVAPDSNIADEEDTSDLESSENIPNNSPVEQRIYPQLSAGFARDGALEISETMDSTMQKPLNCKVPDLNMIQDEHKESFTGKKDSIEENDLKRKKKKLKKEKKNGLSLHLKKGKVRKVNRHGDEVSIGTMNVQKKSIGEQQHVVLAKQSSLFEDHEGEKHSRPWEWTLKKRKNKPHLPFNVSAEHSEPNESIGDNGDESLSFLPKTMNLVNSPINEVGAEEEQSDGEPGWIDDSSVMEELDVKNETERCQHKENEAFLSDNEVSDDEEEKRDELAELMTLSALEGKLIDEEKTEDFDSMWDNVSCDTSTANEFTFKRRTRNHSSKKKSNLRRGTQEIRTEDPPGRLRLFESLAEDHRRKKTKEALSEEFISAINKVFDDETVMEDQENFSSNDEALVEMNHTAIDILDNQSVLSLYVSGTEGNKSKILKPNSSNGADQDRSRSEGSEDDDIHSAEEHDEFGTLPSGDSPSGSKRDSRAGHSYTSSKASRKSNTSRKSRTTRKTKINASEAFEAELKRQKGGKVLSVSSLRQEMSDRRGTSMNLLKKEFVDFKRKSKSTANQIVNANHNTTSNVVPFNDTEHIQEEKIEDLFADKGNSLDGGLSSHFSRWDTGEHVSELDDLMTVKHEPEVGSGILGALAAQGFHFTGGIANQTTDIVNSAAVEVGQHMSHFSSAAHGTTGVALDLVSKTFKKTKSASPSFPVVHDQQDQGFATFSDMPLSTIKEDSDDENERGLLGDVSHEDWDDGFKQKHTRARMGFKLKLPKPSVKLPKTKLPNLKLGFGGRKGTGGNINDMDWMGDDDEGGLLG